MSERCIHVVCSSIFFFPIAVSTVASDSKIISVWVQCMAKNENHGSSIRKNSVGILSSKILNPDSSLKYLPLGRLWAQLDISLHSITEVLTWHQVNSQRFKIRNSMLAGQCLVLLFSRRSYSNPVINFFWLFRWQVQGNKITSVNMVTIWV